MSSDSDNPISSVPLSVSFKRQTRITFAVIGVILLLGFVVVLTACTQRDRNTYSIQPEDVAATCERWTEPSHTVEYVQRDGQLIVQSVPTSETADAVPQPGPLGRIWSYDVADGLSLNLIYDYPIANSLEELDTIICSRHEPVPSQTKYCIEAGTAYTSHTTIAVVNWREDTLLGRRSFGSNVITCVIDNPMIEAVTDTHEVGAWLTSIDQGRME